MNRTGAYCNNHFANYCFSTIISKDMDFFYRPMCSPQQLLARTVGDSGAVVVGSQRVLLRPVACWSGRSVGP